MPVTVPGTGLRGRVLDVRITAADADGLRGEHVVPGPSGAPTRGGAQLLPMGRNFYSLDPDTIPTHTAWEIGKRMADQMIQRYVDEKGEYPREIGFVTAYTPGATCTMLYLGAGARFGLESAAAIVLYAVARVRPSPESSGRESST